LACTTVAADGRRGAAVHEVEEEEAVAADEGRGVAAGVGAGPRVDKVLGYAEVGGAVGVGAGTRIDEVLGNAEVGGARGLGEMERRA
jgi:hypothetical protein